MQPGFIANAAEFAQSTVQGDTASIGPGQMQLGLARELESRGYVTPRANDRERRIALLGRETSVEYVAGNLNYLSDQLSTLPGFSELGVETQNRLILIGYNWGWTGLKSLIEEYGYDEAMALVRYDNETWDEYQRWMSGQ